jgi:hypothetical protein
MPYMFWWEGKIVFLKICLTKPWTGGNRTSSSFLYSRDRDREEIEIGHNVKQTFVKSFLNSNVSIITEMPAY